MCTCTLLYKYTLEDDLNLSRFQEKIQAFDNGELEDVEGSGSLRRAKNWKSITSTMIFVEIWKEK